MRSIVLTIIIGAAVALSAGAQSLSELQEISNNLQQKKQELDKRETKLNEKEKKLEAFEQELLARETQLNKIKQQITERLAEIKQIENENLDKLAKIYQNTKAKSAAQVIVNMEHEKAVQLFQRMSPFAAGKVMAEIGKTNPRYGSKLTELLTPSEFDFQNQEQGQ